MKCILPLAILSFSLAFPQPNVPQQAKVVTAAQVNGTWQSRFGKSRSGTIKILALGKQQLKVEFIGLYTYPLPDGTNNVNDGEGQSIAMIEGTQATFKPDEAEEECLITADPGLCLTICTGPTTSGGELHCETRSAPASVKILRD